jgi:limonene-1,2-epoxide hydrolase
MAGVNKGQKAMIDFLSNSMGPTGKAVEVDWVVLRQTCTGNVVMNERIDRFKQPDGTWQEIPLMGVFDVENGKITRWVDYFDLGKYRAQQKKKSRL